MNKKLTIIAGLCVIESEEQTLSVAKALKKITVQYYDIDFIFKASFDKANRTSINSFRGIGFLNGIRILAKVKKELNIKVLTDVHCPHQANIAQSFVDIIQIPAFLCRQTDLVQAIGQTGKTINIKKGQFLAPEDVKHIIEKVEATGNDNIMVTERGTCFGYHNLVVDYRSFVTMKKFGYPVIFDVTHAQQHPSEGQESGGSTEFVIPMAKGAIGCGVDGLFMEVHPNPKKAKSDKATSLTLEQFEKLLRDVIIIWRYKNYFGA